MTPTRDEAVAAAKLTDKLAEARCPSCGRTCLICDPKGLGSSRHLDPQLLVAGSPPAPGGEVEEAAERVLAKLADDGRERINGGSPSQLDRDMYIAACAYLELRAELARRDAGGEK